MKSLAFCFVWIGEKIACSVRAVNGLTDSFYSLLLFAALKLDFSTSFLILYIHSPPPPKKEKYIHMINPLNAHVIRAPIYFVWIFEFISF